MKAFQKVPDPGGGVFYVECWNSRRTALPSPNRKIVTPLLRPEAL
ncbi:MAG TPA: hypothetical protein VFA09_25315 [Ktedonobacteraceae bacterium]|jgi:hypothetical protein|nr:hypothetical protein [Ktedonobacteraceae bacterium]